MTHITPLPEIHQDMISPDFTRWYDAIIQDDIDTVMEILATVSTSECHKLLHSEINNKAFMAILQARHKKEVHHTRPNNSWNIAVASGAVRVIEMFVNKYNIDVHQVDGNGDNTLHAMIKAACGSPVVEERAVETYLFLCESLQTDDLKNLLKAENKDNFLPVELAILLGTFQLFTVMFSTEGKVYFSLLILVSTCGRWKYVIHYSSLGYFVDI